MILTFFFWLGDSSVGAEGVDDEDASTRSLDLVWGGRQIPGAVRAGGQFGGAHKRVPAGDVGG